MKQKATPKPLTLVEEKEFKKLSREIFKGETFVVFEESERETPGHKRYDELLKKKMAFLGHIEKLKLNN